jgi:hypothetical protein
MRVSQRMRSLLSTLSSVDPWAIIGGACLASGSLASLAELSPARPLPSMAVLVFVVGVGYHWITLRKRSQEAASVADRMAFWVGLALVIGAS